MGFECPVCDAEEADGEHLANHLAFTALVRGGDHEAFLDEHVPDWESMDPETLAPEVTPHATETDTETVTEPQGHADHDHDVPAGNHDHDVPAGNHDHDMPAGQRPTRPDLSGETAEILDDAVELTEAMRDSRVAAPEGDEQTDGTDDAESSDVEDERSTESTESNAADADADSESE